MMKKTNEYIEGRVRWKLSSSIPTENTKYWGQLNSDWRERLDGKVENPILFSAHNEDNFTLVGTRQFYGLDSGIEFLSSYHDIKEIGRAKLSKELIKSEMNSFSVILESGDQLTLHAEKGPALFSIWNVILMLYRMR